jgi:hypothetical protein
MTTALTKDTNVTGKTIVGMLLMRKIVVDAFGQNGKA